LLFCALLLSPAVAIAQDAASMAPTAGTTAPASAQSGDQATTIEAKRRDTIRYGIDSEITDLISDLTNEKDGRYNDDLLSLLQTSRNAKLRITVLDFLAGLEWKGAEKFAMDIMGDRDNTDTDLVASALSYLAAIRSKDALALSSVLIKEDNKKLLPALVRLMGRAGGPDEEKLLLDWFDGDSTTPALKEEAIKALGDIGSAKAAARLAKVVADTEAGKAARMFACDSLAKIKDESSVDALVKAANDADPNVRTSAISALGVFASLTTKSGDDARSALIGGLRDSYVKTRIAACKAAADAKLAEAIPYLRYKAQNDPEMAVKTEALRSLAVLGGDSFDFLRQRLEDNGENPQLRTLCFGLLAHYDAIASMSVLEARLSAEEISKDRAFYTRLAREVANADKAPGIAALARVLISDKEYLIRIAGIEWARKNRAQDFKTDLENLAKNDPSDMIKKRATDALKSY
jgi:hypothetical protein